MITEIKLRVYSKLTKNFIYASLEWLLAGSSATRSIFLNNQETIDRYAGLPDCKGKDIYESDIVKFCDHYNGDTRVENSIGIVVFENAEFFIKTLKGDYMNLWETVKNYDGEIIANIYENPELIIR